MSVRRHPCETILAAYASGALADGPGLTTAAHLEVCPKCRRAVGLLEAVGGALVEALEPSALEAQALGLALARIERPYRAEPPPMAKPSVLGGMRLPAALAGRRIGPRRWVAPGLWAAQVHSNAPAGWRTYLLRAGKGARLPDHGHHGPELTTVLHGAFTDETGRYGPGDFGQADAGFDHRPRVDDDGPCLCLISAKGGMRAHGLARLLRPLLKV